MIPEINEYIESIKIDKSQNTTRTYTKAISLLLEFTEAGNFSEFKKIQSQDLREFQKFLKDNGSSISTINTRMRPIKAMFNWFVENDYMEISPAAKIKDLKVGKKIPSFLSEDEIDKMINSAKNDLDRLIIGLLVTTGIRRNELIQLKLSGTTI